MMDDLWLGISAGDWHSSFRLEALESVHIDGHNSHQERNAESIENL